MQNNLNVYKLSFIFLCIIAFKIWLSHDRFFQANVGYTHDDGLYFEEAQYILEGNWLGPYTNRTLLRGVGFPLFIATSSILNIPLGLSYQLLYIFACIIFFISVKPHIKNIYIAIFITGLLILDPTIYFGSYSDVFLRQYFNLSIAIIVASCAFAVIRHPHKDVFSYMWSFCFGLSVGIMQLTRGEYIWILPLTIITMLFLLGQIFFAYKLAFTSVQKQIIIFCYYFFFLGFFFLSTIVKYVNYTHYGAVITDELQSKPMISAYSALIRVKSDVWQPHIPLSTSTRNKIYQVSPTFSELEESLEGNIGDNWTQNSDLGMVAGMNTNSLNLEKGELAGGWFVFALRDAVADAGYYKDLPSTMAYYSRLAEEINNLCEQKILECDSNTNSFMPSFDFRYIPDLLKSSRNALLLIMTSPHINNEIIYRSFAKSNQLTDVSKITHEENIVPVDKDIMLNEFSIIRKKIIIINLFSTIYSLFIPLLFVTSLALFIVRWYKVLIKKSVPANLIIQTGILMSAISLILIVSLVHITSFPAIYMEYLAPAHSFILIFILFNFIKTDENQLNFKRFKFP